MVDYHPTFTTTTYVRLWVDTDNDADFSDEATQLGQFTSDAKGHVGLYRGAEGSTVQRFEDFKVGIDNNGDDDFDDGGDEIVISDDFNSNTTSLTYDNNGNLTDDGIFGFVYDAWNRLVKAKHRRPTGSGAAASTVKAIEYLGDQRLATQTLSNSGTEVTLHDGGNRIDERYYAFGRLAESRNGSSQTVQHVLWDAASGGRTVVWIENNGDPTIGNDTTPDTEASGENVETPGDARYFFHTSRGGREVSITQYDTAGTSNGKIVVRYAIGMHEPRLILNGDSGTGEMANAGFSNAYSLYDQNWCEASLFFALLDFSVRGLINQIANCPGCVVPNIRCGTNQECPAIGGGTHNPHGGIVVCEVNSAEIIEVVRHELIHRLQSCNCAGVLPRCGVNHQTPDCVACREIQAWHCGRSTDLDNPITADDIEGCSASLLGWCARNPELCEAELCPSPCNVTEACAWNWAIDRCGDAALRGCGSCRGIGVIY